MCSAMYRCTAVLAEVVSVACDCFRPKRNPLFLMDLIMDNQGVHFSTHLPNFESVLITLFDKGINSTHNVPQLEKVGFAAV